MQGIYSGSALNTKVISISSLCLGENLANYYENLREYHG